jgi:hypothetical protein
MEDQYKVLPDALNSPVRGPAQRRAWEICCGGGIEDGVEGIPQEENALGGEYRSRSATHAQTDAVWGHLCTKCFCVVKI